MQQGVSVIICCFNSSARLPETLRYLAWQQVPAHIPWEIIIIDNASTDDTAAVAKSLWAQYNLAGIEFKVVAQPQSGLSHAREKGIATATYAYLLFCDDDNWLFSNYIALAYERMSADAMIGVLGGCGTFEPELPSWSEVEKYKTSYVNGPQYWADTHHWVYGAGSVYRKSVLEQLKNHNWKQITTGRTAKKLLAGEDIELCFMFYLMGYKIVFDERLKFKHFVPLKRQNLQYIIKLNFGHSYTNVLLNGYYFILNKDDRRLQTVLNNWLIGATKTLLKSALLFLFQKIKLNNGPSADQQISFNSHFGTFCALLKNRKKIAAQNQHVKQLLPLLQLTSPHHSTID